jgi:hypothetical protein
MRFSRKIVARLITLAAALAVIVSVATPAHASLDYSGDYNVIHMENGYCLDSNGTSVYTHVCGGAYQSWEVYDSEDTLYQDATGLCLDGSGTSVYILSCNGGAFQNWEES